MRKYLGMLAACIMLSSVNILWRTGHLLKMEALASSEKDQKGIVAPGRDRGSTADEPASLPDHRGSEIKYNSMPERVTESGRIPKVVHQTYKSTDLPPNFKTWRDECIRQNPGWEFRIWTDDDNLRLVKEHYPQLLELYRGYDVNIKRIDMVRYLYLHKYGGLYMDLDMTCLKPFGTMFDDHEGKFVIASQYRPGRGVVEGANAFMASPPGLDFFDSIFRELPLRGDRNVLVATGSKFLKRFVLYDRANRGKWTGLPMELIYAQEWDEEDKCRAIEDCRGRFPRAVTVSFWTHTWKKDYERD